MNFNRRNLIIFNFQENEITYEELVSNIISFFNVFMKAIIKHADIDTVYRMGKA